MFINIPEDEFKKYAVKHHGINSTFYDSYTKAINNMTRSVIEERDVPFREVDVFSRLMADRIIFIGTEIDDYVSNIIQAQLLFLDATDPEKDIQIYFNTPGGSIYGGFGIYDTMQYITPDISCICTGMAASMGAVLLAAGTKGKRYALKHSRIMLHQPYGMVYGQAADVQIDVAHLREMQKDLYDIIAYHTGQPVEKVEKDADRDFWMRPDDAKEYGIIDEVIERNKNK